jgi:hypothetical protein
MRLAAICLGALALFGCGADEAAQEVRDTVDPVAEAADKMAASGGARVDGELTLRGAGFVLPLTIDGAISFEDDESRSEMDLAERGIPGATATQMEEARRAMGLPLRLITRGNESFLNTPRVEREGRQDGVRWLKIDYEEVDEESDLDFSGINQMSEVSPDAMLRFLRTVADARETGRRTMDGVATTRYTATVDIRDYPDTVEPERREAAQRTVEVLTKAWGSPTHRVNVWIDDDGLIRREEMTYSFTDGGEKLRARALLDFLDVGRPHEIAFPDDDEVIDVSDELAGYLRRD